MSKCKKCGDEVVWKEKPGGGFFPPENKDGSRHDCEKKAAPQQPKEDSRIGIYGGIVRGQISLTLRSGIMMSQVTPDLLKCLTDPNTAVKNGMKVKFIFGKDGKAEKAEVCPDQPAPAIKPPVTCTPPVADPAGGIEGIVAATKANANLPLTREEDVWQAERTEFEELLRLTEREDLRDLLHYIEAETDFFIAPSSSKYHDARAGGLLHHSLGVYHNLVAFSKTFVVDVPADSLIIIGLLHDLCKANFYKTSTRNKKDEKTGTWYQEPFIDIDDQFPLGHGEKSAILLLRYIQLTDQEIMAIRWHMMAYDDIRCSYAGNLAITNACAKFPIIVLTHMADLSASFLEMRKPESGGVQ
jgi:hypothetical protein